MEAPSFKVQENFPFLVNAFGTHLRDKLGKYHTFSVYDHLVICHSVIELWQWGSLCRYGSWFLEALNSLWKAFLKEHTSRGRGKGENANRDKQALQALSIKQHHKVAQEYTGSLQVGSNRGAGSYTCGRCGQKKERGHSKICSNQSSGAS